MRSALAFVAALAAGPALGQDWVLQDGESFATACAGGGSGGAVTDFCLSLGCPEGGGLRAVVSVSAGSPGVAVRAGVVVDGREAGALDLRRSDAGATWEAAVDGGGPLVAALRGGTRAVVRLDWKGGGIEQALGLAGSDAAIGRAVEACAPPPLAPSGVISPAAALLLGTAPRTSEDPAGEAVGHNAGFCAQGVPGVEPGFATLRDLDGDGVNDLVLDWVGLSCDGRREFCGSGGCSVEVWMGDRAGPWRLVLEGLIEGVEVPGPGRLHVLLDGADCGLAGAAACSADFRFEGGEIRPD